MIDAVIVGGGAGGFFAAAVLGEAAPGRSILILEKGEDVLAKVRLSGGGRCNVTHACFDPPQLVTRYPRGGDALRGPLTRFQPQDTMDWFEARGVRLKVEEDGRVFPVSDRSATIVECLKDAAARAGTVVRTRSTVADVHRSESGFDVILTDGEKIPCRRLLLTTGGDRRPLEWSRALGHRIVVPVPSLFSFHVPQDKRLQGLAGVSVEDAWVGLQGSTWRQRGPLLVTHVGLSGPAVLKLSAWGARDFHDLGYKARLTVNWRGEAVAEETAAALRVIKAQSPRRLVSSQGVPGIPTRLWERLAAAGGAPEGRRWADVSKKELEGMARELTAGVYVMDGKSAFKEEFVTCGGVHRDDVDFRTMESRRCPDLFFAGEILDVDGVTGGFNFQNAWTTGWTAGRAMAAGFMNDQVK